MMPSRVRLSAAVPVWRGLLVLLLLALAALACDVSTSTTHFENTKFYKSPEGQTVTRVFKTDEAIYVRARLKNAPNDTALKAIWILQPDTIMLVEELTVNSGEIALEAAPPSGGWPTGSYRLELYTNGDRVQTLDFQVK
jgi:hypothetical protein